MIMCSLDRDNTPHPSLIHTKSSVLMVLSYISLLIEQLYNPRPRANSSMVYTYRVGYVNNVVPTFMLILLSHVFIGIIDD